MWYSDTIAQEIVWTDEDLFPCDTAYDFEDESPWSSEDEDWEYDAEAEWERMAEDAAMEGHLFGWDA